MPAEEIQTGGKPDFAKTARRGLAGVVIGRLGKAGSIYSLEVSLLTSSGEPRMSRTLAADSGGKVSIVDIVAASSEIIAVVERPESKEPKVATEGGVAKVSKARAKGKASRVASKQKGGRKVAARPVPGRTRS